MDHHHEWKNQTPPAKAGLATCSWSSLASVEWVEVAFTCCWLMGFLRLRGLEFEESIPKKDVSEKATDLKYDIYRLSIWICKDHPGVTLNIDKLAWFQYTIFFTFFWVGVLVESFNKSKPAAIFLTSQWWTIWHLRRPSMYLLTLERNEKYIIQNSLVSPISLV